MNSHMNKYTLSYIHRVPIHLQSWTKKRKCHTKLKQNTIQTKKMDKKLKIQKVTTK